MDLLHEQPMLQGVRQMLGMLAKTEIRPIAIQHDQEESMPWELMKKAGNYGLKQTALIDAAKGQIPGATPEPEDDPERAKKPRKSTRIAVVGSEEMAWGCAGIALALGGSGLAATPVAAIGTTEQKQEFVGGLEGLDEKGHI